MLRVGLIPPDTGKVGGKQTGQNMDHLIEAGGRFQMSCARLAASGVSVPYVERSRVSNPAKAAGKTRYTCTECRTNVRGKPGISLFCGTCTEKSGGKLISMVRQS